MRIAHVTQPTTAGVAVVVRDLARAGVESGDEVTVLSPEEGELPGWCAELGIPWRAVELRRLPGPWDVRALLALRRALTGFDVVHLHSSKAGALGRLVLRGGRATVVFTPHGWSWYAGAGVTSRVYRTVERLAARWCDAIVCVSQAEAADGRGVLGQRAPIVVVPNGVDTDRFSPAAEPVREPGLVVCVGRLCHQKGQDRLLRVLARSRTPGLRVRLVGAGPDRASLLELAHDLGVQDRVELVGQGDPVGHLRAADLVVGPSRWEGMSLAMLEAMSVGSAVVTTTVAGAEALRGVGVLVEQGPEPQVLEDLTAAVDGLLPDGARLARLRSESRARAVADYSWPSVVARHRDVWAAPRARQGQP